MDHLSPGDKAQLGQRVDAVPIQRGLEGEVIAGERLDRRQPAHAQRRLDAAVLAKGQLLAQQDVDRFQGADLSMLQAAHDLVQRLQGAGHLQADQVAADDYKRHGTTTLFAALNILDGAVIGRCMQKHRHQEFIRFLNAIERDVPAGKIIHAVMDNYATHKHPKVRAWLARHPRWVFHFTPASASWLNAVEGFFSILTRRRLRRGVFKGVVDLQAAINRYLKEHNADPKPFVWTKPASEIFDKLARLTEPSV